MVLRGGEYPVMAGGRSGAPRRHRLQRPQALTLPLQSQEEAGAYIP